MSSSKVWDRLLLWLFLLTITMPNWLGEAIRCMWKWDDVKHIHLSFPHVPQTTIHSVESMNAETYNVQCFCCFAQRSERNNCWSKQCQSSVGASLRYCSNWAIFTTSPHLEFRPNNPSVHRKQCEDVVFLVRKGACSVDFIKLKFIDRQGLWWIYTAIT